MLFESHLPALSRLSRSSIFVTRFIARLLEDVSRGLFCDIEVDAVGYERPAWCLSLGPRSRGELQGSDILPLFGWGHVRGWLLGWVVRRLRVVQVDKSGWIPQGKKSQLHPSLKTCVAKLCATEHQIDRECVLLSEKRLFSKSQRLSTHPSRLQTTIPTATTGTGIRHRHSARR